jgi:hypothetical protein
MPEGLGIGEVGKEIAEHKKSEEEHAAEEHDRASRILTILEALLLATVAILAAYSGFAAAKWSTESSLSLAQASTARNLASRAQLAGLQTKNFDGLTFNAWFSAYESGNKKSMAVAERRFRPEFDVAFKAWLKTDPFTNPAAPKGPTYMPEYVQPAVEQTAAYDEQANHHYHEGEHAASTADNYVRTTVFLASVLFLVGIAGHFRVRAARVGLISVGAAILILSVILVILSPAPKL